MAERGNRGGRRAGRPGVRYPNRTDLALAPRTAPTVAITGQGYGQASAAAETQQVVTGAAEAARAAVPPPDIMGRLTRPTERPHEPVTAGLPTGPGPGPEVLGLQDAPSQSLRAWLLEHPFDEDVRQVIELLEAEGR